MGKNMKNVVLWVVAASLLAGCSVFEKKRDDYKKGATQVQPLEVPPDLTAPETNQQNIIPGTDGEQVASYSEYMKQTTEQPCAAPASAPVAASAPAVAMPSAKLLENNGVKTIQLNEPFDRSWRKIGLALDRARIVVADKDRSKGTYFVAAKPGKDDKSEDFQVTVRENRDGSEIAVIDADGKSSAETSAMLEKLYLNLGDNPADAVRTPR